MQAPELVSDLVQMATWWRTNISHGQTDREFWTAALAYFTLAEHQERAQLARVPMMYHDILPQKKYFLMSPQGV